MTTPPAAASAITKPRGGPVFDAAREPESFFLPWTIPGMVTALSSGVKLPYCGHGCAGLRAQQPPPCPPSENPRRTTRRRAAERRGGEGVAALGGGGARGVAGGGDERSAAAGPDSAVRLSGATGVAAAGGSAPGRQPATAHVQTRIALCKHLLHMQQKVVIGAGGNGWVATALRLADGEGIKALSV